MFATPPPPPAPVPRPNQAPSPFVGGVYNYGDETTPPDSVFTVCASDRPDVRVWLRTLARLFWGGWFALRFDRSARIVDGNHRFEGSGGVEKCVIFRLTDGLGVCKTLRLQGIKYTLIYSVLACSGYRDRSTALFIPSQTYTEVTLGGHFS